MDTNGDGCLDPAEFMSVTREFHEAHHRSSYVDSAAQNVATRSVTDRAVGGKGEEEVEVVQKGLLQMWDEDEEDEADEADEEEEEVKVKGELEEEAAPLPMLAAAAAPAYMGLEAEPVAAAMTIAIPEAEATTAPKPPSKPAPKSPKRAATKTVDYQDLEQLKRNTEKLFREKVRVRVPLQ